MEIADLLLSSTYIDTILLYFTWADERVYNSSMPAIWYSSTITSFFHTWQRMVTHKCSCVKFKNFPWKSWFTRGVKNHKTWNATRCGISHEVWNTTKHVTYVHGKSCGHRYSMSWACWLSTKKSMSTHTNYFLLHSQRHVSIANTEL